jgi:gliding motility-associated-like protein
VGELSFFAYFCSYNHKYMRFFIFLLLLISFSANAQPVCGGLGGTAESNNAVCGETVFSQINLPNCVGSIIPIGNICINPNTGVPEVVRSDNSVWYKFRCYQNGTLGFLITPNLPGDDYDWCLMNITGRLPQDVYTTNLSVSINLSATTGSTGCTAAGIGDINCAGPTLRYNRLVPVTAGNDYLLMVTNWNGSGSGYSLDFIGGSAVVINNLAPTITNVKTVTCNQSQIRVSFSEDILCSSLTALASELSITNGTNVITSVTSSCNAGSNAFTELIINLQNPLTPGAHNLVVGNGTDGNTLLDICNDQMLPTSIPFSVSATPPPPIVTAAVALCQGTTANPLSASGTNLLWYTTATGGTGSAIAPTPLTTATGTTSYYVSQSASGGCESPRALINVTVNPVPGLPSVSSPVTYCQDETAIPLTIIGTGTGILWFTALTGGTGAVTAPTPPTTTVGTTPYYVSQTLGTCEGQRAFINVTIKARPPAPTVTSPLTVCQGATPVGLTAGGTNLLWYTTPAGGTGSTTAPSPSTTALGSTNYYVSQSSAATGGCEGPRALITVTVSTTPSAPVVNPVVTYCQGKTAMALTASGSNLLWYTVPTNGTGIATAPIPSTTSVGTTIYYVSQTFGTCEGPRASITVTINSTPTAPAVPAPTVNYCVGATAMALTASGTNLLWYTVPTNGTGSATAPTPLTATAGNISYYVSQTTGICEGPRTQVTVVVTDIPSAPLVISPVVYCQGAASTALTTTTGTNLLWYTVPTAGTGSTTAPTPLTTNTGNTTYYVSQSTNNCEGPRAAIVVTVNPTPSLPTVTTPIVYCQNAMTNPLIVNGTNLQWHTTAINGTANTIAPLISSTAAGTFTYYVAQKLGNCEGPRAAIVVNITATPTPPTVISPLNICPNDVALPLKATGTNLLWYNTETGGVGSTIAPTPSTLIFPATYNYYVSQTTTAATGSCEGSRAAMVVTVDNPLAINVGRDSTICEGQLLKLLPVVTPIGATYEWRANGVPISSIDNIFIKDATVNPIDTAEYILKAILGGCSKEDTINVNVIWKPIINAGLTKAICLDSSILLTGIVSHNSNDSVSFLWSPTDSLATPDALQTLAYPTKTTLYTLSFQTKPTYGCDFKGSSSVKLVVQKIDKAFAGNDTIAVKGVPHALMGSGGLNYTWSSPSGINISNPFSQKALVTLNDDAQFYLKVTDAIGCEGRDTIFVKVYNGPTFYVPNSFTPNGDGVNDIFRAIPVGIANSYFRIFNRNGQLMFETTQYLKGWDGTFNGKPQPNGTYVWIVTGTNRDYKKVKMKGTVNLIR